MIPGNLSRAERALVVIALFFIVVLAIKAAEYIVSLFLVSLVLALLAFPALQWLKARGFSDLSATLLITVLSCLAILAIAILTAFSFSTLVSDIPQYQTELNARLAEISGILAAHGIAGPASQLSFSIADVVTMGLSGAMSIADALVFLFFVGATTFFLLLEAPRLLLRLEGSLGKDSATLRNLSRMTGYVIDFMVVRTETNFIHGVLFGGFLGLLGVHGAILWGTLTFLLGYIPYFGLVLAALPALFFAWLQFGLPGVAAVIAAVCILNLIVENPVYSYLAARKFEIPPLVVLLSVIFWGWLLGLAGMLFAIPFTLLLFLAFEDSGDLRWINGIVGAGHLFVEDDRESEAGENGPS